MLTKLLCVGVGGFLGAVARYGISGVVQDATRSSFPFGTLAVNVLGCLVIGAAMASVDVRQLFGPAARLLLMTGFLGALTTFSTFGYETLELLRTGDFAGAALNAALNLFAGLAAVWAGAALVRLSVA